jgi:integral membrane protein (TIGR01906 family)
VPTFLVTLNLRLAINSAWLYEYGFERYDAEGRTGLPREELLKAGAQVREYFNNSEQELHILVNVGGLQQELYNQREIAHMRDVKGLVQGVYLWQWLSLGFLLGATAIGFLLWRGRFWPTLAQGLLWGSGVTLVGILLAGLGALVGFDALFTQFHLISFSNDLWRLDPARDRLIQMFPESFFRDSTLFVALGSLLMAAVVGGASLIYLRRSKQSYRLQVGWLQERSPVAKTP